MTDSGLITGIGGCGTLRLTDTFTRYTRTYAYEFDARPRAWADPDPRLCLGRRSRRGTRLPIPELQQRDADRAHLQRRRTPAGAQHGSVLGRFRLHRQPELPRAGVLAALRPHAPDHVPAAGRPEPDDQPSRLPQRTPVRLLGLAARVTSPDGSLPSGGHARTTRGTSRPAASAWTCQRTGSRGSGAKRRIDLRLGNQLILIPHLMERAGNHARFHQLDSGTPQARGSVLPRRLARAPTQPGGHGEHGLRPTAPSWIDGTAPVDQDWSVATCESAPGYQSDSWPSCQRTRYGGSPSACGTSSTSPTRRGASTCGPSVTTWSPTLPSCRPPSGTTSGVAVGGWLLPAGPVLPSQHRPQHERHPSPRSDARCC